jgi:hypothetical protein
LGGSVPDLLCDIGARGMWFRVFDIMDISLLATVIIVLMRV